MEQPDTSKQKRTFLTPSEAAREAGVSRSTLYRGLRSGLLSASRGADGKSRIDAVELHRVYSSVPPETSQSVPDTSHMTQGATPDDTPIAAVLVATMKGRIDALETEVDYLRRALADAQNEKGRLLGLLETKALPGPKMKKRKKGKGKGKGK